MKKFILSALTALLLLAPTTTAVAEDSPTWAEIGTSVNGDVWYARWVDLRAGRSNQTDAKVWLKIKLNSKKNPPRKFVEDRSLHSVNCISQTHTLITAVSYSPDGQSTSRPGRGEAIFIVPGTLMETLSWLLCADKPQP